MTSLALDDWIEFDDGECARLGRISNVRGPQTYDVVAWDTSACGTLVPSDQQTLTFAASSIRPCPDAIVEAGDGFMYADDAEACPDHIITTAQLSDFIVPDHDDDAFRPSDSSDSFTHSTHDAVRQWNQWTPSQPDAKRFKGFVESIEARVMQSEEERAFRQGVSINHRHPPKK